MLALLIEAASAKYALDATTVVEVAPLADLRVVPHVPTWLRGLLRYRGGVVPVVDLSLLLGGAAVGALMSTRIVIDEVMLAGERRRVGVLVSRVLDVKAVGAAVFPAMAVDGAPYLGGIVDADGARAQLIRTSEILPAKLAEILFADPGARVAG